MFPLDKLVNEFINAKSKSILDKYKSTNPNETEAIVAVILAPNLS